MAATYLETYLSPAGRPQVPLAEPHLMSIGRPFRRGTTVLPLAIPILRRERGWAILKKENVVSFKFIPTKITMSIILAAILRLT